MKLTCHGGSHDGREIEIPEADIGFERIVRLAKFQPFTVTLPFDPGEIPTVEIETYVIARDSFGLALFFRG